MTAATLFVVGMGPGDPELLTVKAARVIGSAPVVAHFARRGSQGHARGIAQGLLHPRAEELRLEYPFTTEIPLADPRYAAGIDAFHDASAALLAGRLACRQDVALLCEGDPFFYGSAMHLLDRLPQARVEVIPGISGMSGGWTRALLPMTHGDDVLTVLPGTLDAATLTERLARCDAAVIMKLGRNLAKVRAALDAAGLLGRAVYVERGTMATERILPLAELQAATAPYFSLVLVPGRQRRR
jgi:precorrin-2/cobalt-factor-2 C20-methyltransferase